MVVPDFARPTARASVWAGAHYLEVPPTLAFATLVYSYG